MYKIAEGLVDEWMTKIRESGDAWDSLMNTYYLACQLYLNTVDKAMDKVGEKPADIFSQGEPDPDYKPN